MKRVAFFVDGNYLFNQVRKFKSFFLNGQNLLAYCRRHVGADEEIYRIFYYDAPPLEGRTGKNPLGGEVDFGASSTAQQMLERLRSLQETPYVALRLGRVSWHNDWVIRPGAMEGLLAGDKTLSDLCADDFLPNFKQKSVDMKIGLDIATLAFKKLASRMVIIAGDTDFAPATKLARTEGLHVTVDPFGAKLSPELLKHVDWVSCPLDPDKAEDVAPYKRSHFVPCKKTL